MKERKFSFFGGTPIMTKSDIVLGGEVNIPFNALFQEKSFGAKIKQDVSRIGRINNH